MSVGTSSDTLGLGAFPLHPLPCDRWVARSCFQKAIRRGHTELAVRALANLFLHDPRAIWRHLVIVALEDIGVADVEILRSILGAKDEHSVRRAPGSLWNTFVDLTERLAASEHSQAVCDLLLRAENQPPTPEREMIIEGGPQSWASVLYDHGSSMQQKATAALAFAGSFDAAAARDPVAVFEICSEDSEKTEISDLARNAWRVSRNPMALLFPIVWSSWCKQSDCSTRDDQLPKLQSTDEIPEYALDQFTRIGKSAIRVFMREDADLQSLLARTAIPERQWASIVGDVLFLVEGGVCVRRMTWGEAEMLRRPARWLPATGLLGGSVRLIMEIIPAKLRQLSDVRQQLYHRAS